jgi:hypothetical protein
MHVAVFRSAIDSWAISQVFPVMPIHRLEQVRGSVRIFMRASNVSLDRRWRDCSAGACPELVRFWTILCLGRYGGNCGIGRLTSSVKIVLSRKQQ